MSEHPKYNNRLQHEKSPYLLQHAHNPVDWYPWGEEAFEAARDADKPIFLSIGYATCHWCHVMERESFEDLEIAHLLNETFINIKVDREELPEVDALYMEFAQSMMSGAAGWPLNLVLTPERLPFFAATYLPPVERHGLMSIQEMITSIQELWKDPQEREHVIMQAERVVEVFGENVHLEGDELPVKEQIDLAAEILFKLADPIYGGMKGAPKFPIGYQTNFMLREAASCGDSRALFLVEKGLEMMHRGGIYDHLGGGFSRYSVDERWEVPHFEKMLYDNAQLAFSYLEGWVALHKPHYRIVCEETLDYILKEMTHPEGGFYSAQDADSEGVEGYYYTWPQEEIIELLGEEESLYFREFYGVTPKGNFEGRNILHTQKRLEDFAFEKGVDSEILSELFFQQKKILYEVRSERTPPAKDDKILAAWNGLTLFTLAEAGRALDRADYLQAAQKAGSFIKEKMWDGNTLYRRWRDGEHSFRCGLDDYAFLIRGVLSLFEANCGEEWLVWALQLTEQSFSNFKSDKGAFYQTDGTNPYLLLRQCEYNDGAEPSGNAVHCENLLRLYQLTGNVRYLDAAEDILKAVAPFLENYAPGYCYHLIALNRYYDRSAPTLVLAVGSDEEAAPYLRQIYSTFIPHKALVVCRDGDDSLRRLLPLLEGKKRAQEGPALYVCREGACSPPVTGMGEITAKIATL